MKVNKEFNKIYEDTYHQVLRYVIAKCDNLASVEDIVQSVYIKVYEVLEKKGLEYFERPIPLLIKFCKNELFKYYNLKKKLELIFYEDEVKYYLNDVSVHEDIERNFIINATLDEIWKLIQKEDIEVQKIAALYFLDEMTIKDIANLLGLNENTTKTKLYRLIKKLKSLNVEE